MELWVTIEVKEQIAIELIKTLLITEWASYWIIIGRLCLDDFSERV
jgi:hypothetical protein